MQEAFSYDNCMKSTIQELQEVNVQLFLNLAICSCYHVHNTTLTDTFSTVPSLVDAD